MVQREGSYLRERGTFEKEKMRERQREKTATPKKKKKRKKKLQNYVVLINPVPRAVPSRI